MALTGSALAQPTNPVNDTAPCLAGRADVERRMEIARSKGQMLLRRQLAEQLTTLEATCQPLAADQGGAANIERLEKEVQALRAELEAAEEQLRRLKGEVNR